MPSAAALVHLGGKVPIIVKSHSGCGGPGVPPRIWPEGM
jgi:hypothetical protein